MHEPAPAARRTCRAAAPRASRNGASQHQPLDQAEPLGVELLDRRHVLDAGVVDQDVDVHAVPRPSASIDVAVGQVGDQVARRRPPRRPAGRRPRRGRAPARWAPSAASRARDRAADAAGAAGDQGGAAGEDRRVACGHDHGLSHAATLGSGPHRRTCAEARPRLVARCSSSLPSRQRSATAGGAAAAPAGRRGPGRVAPAVAEQRADPVQPLGDGVRVDVQPLGGLRGPAAGREPRLQGARPARCRAARRRPAPARPWLSMNSSSSLGAVLAEQQPGQPEAGGVADLAGAAQRDQRVQAAPGLARTPRASRRAAPAGATPTVASAPPAASTRVAQLPAHRERLVRRRDQHHPAVVLAGQPAAARREPGGDLGRAVPLDALDPRHRHAPWPSRSAPCRRARSRSRAASRSRPVEQVAEQLAAHPLLGLGDRAPRTAAPAR